MQTNQPVAGRTLIDGATGQPPDEIKPGHYGERGYRREALAIELTHMDCPPAPNT